jgi:signal transduction histidine kinase/ligand-binding sensor domain-containing protein/DNA-binding response OmpR family regulator
MSVKKLQNIFQISNFPAIAGFNSFKVICLSVLIIYLVLVGTVQAGNDFISTYSNARFKHLTINDGLSQNFISSIHQDHRGFIWIGTKDGVNMYDGYSFTIYKHDPFDPFSISDNFIKSIYSDSKGRLWVGTLNGGLNLFDRQSGRFIRFMHESDNNNSISNNNVQAIIEDKSGNIWIGTNGGGLNKLSFSGSELLPEKSDVAITRFNDSIKGFPMANLEVHCLLIDRRNVLWIGTTQDILSTSLTNTPVFRQVPFELPISSSTPNVLNAGGRVIFEGHDGTLWSGNAFGLFQYHHEKQIFIKHQFNDPNLLLQHTLAATAFKNKESEELWISTNKELIIINTITGELTSMVHKRNRSGGLQKGRIISLFPDQSGTMWIGSNGYGISLFDPHAMKFSYPQEYVLDTHGMPFSTRDLSIRAFYETYGVDNYLWIGANEGLFRVDLAPSELKAIDLTDSLNDGNSIIFSIQGDDNGLLWLGTNWGLISYNPYDHSSRIFPTNLIGPDQSREPSVSNVFINGKDIWAITPNTIAFFDQVKEEFEHIFYNDDPFNEFRETVFPKVFQAKDGNLWVGTHTGLHYYDWRTKELSSFVNNPKDPGSLNYNNVSAIVPDPKLPESYLWLATGGGGISRFDVINKVFKSYTEQDGLSNNMVYGMLYDESGNLWVSTNKGLSKFNLNKETFTNYAVSDGLQSNEFNGGAFYRSLRGEMFFGGINGYNHFFPSQVKYKQFLTPVAITAFKLLTDSDELNDSVVLDNISESRKVTLRHNQNHFRVEFSSLDFANPERNRFAYSLTTSGENWINTGTNHSITLTDMKPDFYTLKIRGTNNDGVWSDQVASLQIHITQPWWKQTWAYLFYLGLITAAFIGLRHYELSRLRLRNTIKITNLESNKLKELDSLKSQFYANISHEFRTPLSLIKGPVEQMLEEDNDPVKQKTLKVMHANSERLLTLINQLLDLSKLESGQYKLKVSTGDIVGLMKGLVMSFLSITEQKTINLRFIEAPSLKSMRLRENFYFDSDIIEKIITNLLSNAVKFTPANGKITVSACLRQMRNNKEVFEVTIRDSGIGIPKAKLPFIYDRFYQVDASSQRAFEGAGIGLAYVKELVELHKGNIAVMSKPGKGTTFRLRLPFDKNLFAPDQIVPADEQTIPIRLQEATISFGDFPSESEQIQKKNAKERSLVLIVEDHDDVREYICESLRNSYQLLDASAAKDGLNKAQEFIPDLIISDVMMPGMDGFEFCEKIKSDEKTSHIPVILLTAKASGNDRIQGLETGADDYLTKPFNTRELLVRAKNLIQSRHILREKFQLNAIIKPGEISVSSRDRIFMEKLLRTMENNISSEHFSVEELSNEIGMSSSQLHRKLKALVNQSAIQFIRSVRMNRAKELLEKDAGNIADIAYMVGYADPGYFSKTYRAFFGKLPSEVKKNGNL